MYHIMRNRLSSDRGLSLLEVLISMIILAVGILGLAPMVVLSIEGNSISRDFAIASEIAKKQLEELEAAGELLAEDPLLAAEGEMVDDTLITLTDTLGCTRQVLISPVDAVNPPTLCKVDVIITWTDKVGAARSTQHSTLMMNN